MSITFLVTVLDDGDVLINKLADLAGPAMRALGTDAHVRSLGDPTFETGKMGIGDRIDLHVKLTEQVKRDVIITVLDDAVPLFANPEEAEAWMAARQSGPMARYG